MQMSFTPTGLAILEGAIEELGETRIIRAIGSQNSKYRSAQ
jgi:hypothetical protein